MRSRRLVLNVLVVLAAGGCMSGAGMSDLGGAQGPTATTATSPAPRVTSAGGGSPTTDGPATSVMGGGRGCSYRQEDGYALPDPGCTPGVTNPGVSEANMGQTICSPGWTSTVRPPESYTEALKRQQMDLYGDTGSMSGYEEDHLIPLELGGSPADPKNLWPEPGASPNPKDDVEYAANRAVCRGTLPLAEAQREIASDWVSLGRSLGVLEGTN